MIKQFMNRQRIADHKAADQTGLERESQKGASAIEYVMIIAVIVIAIVIAFTQTGLGDWVTETFRELETELQGGAAPPGGV